MSRTNTHLIDTIKGCKAVYAIMCFEAAPTTGQAHIHVYYQFRSPKARSTLTKYFQAWKPHLEACRGNHLQNVTYCKKGGDWEEWGAPLQQGQRTDINNLTDMIDQGKTMAEIARADPSTFVRCVGGLMQYLRKTRDIPRDFRSACTWIHGEFATGKSYFVKQKHGDSLYIKEPAHKWWNNYEGQEAVLIDDFDAADGFWRTKEGLRTLLRLLDEGPCQVEYKGGMQEFNSRFIYITSEFHPSHYWSGNELNQVVSRIGSIQHFTTKFASNRKRSAEEALRSAEEYHARRKMVAALEGDADFMVSAVAIGAGHATPASGVGMDRQVAIQHACTTSSTCACPKCYTSNYGDLLTDKDDILSVDEEEEDDDDRAFIAPEDDDARPVHCPPAPRKVVLDDDDEVVLDDEDALAELLFRED